MGDFEDIHSCSCGCGGHDDIAPTNGIMPDWKKASDEEVVCHCCKVSKGQIRQAIEMGAYTIPLVKVATGACRGKDCERTNPLGRNCAADIQELIRIYHQGPPEWLERGPCCG